MNIALDAGADPNLHYGGASHLGSCLSSRLFRQLSVASDDRHQRKEILSALIYAGADVSHVSIDGDSVTVQAWGFGHWEAWCGALQKNGLAMIEVDQSEPQGYFIPSDNESETGDSETQDDSGSDLDDDPDNDADDDWQRASDCELEVESEGDPELES